MVSGFDTLKFISPEFAHAFGTAIRDFAKSVGKRNFFSCSVRFIILEETIAQFIGRDPEADKSRFGVDSALDYPLFYALPQVAKGLPDAVPADIAAVFEKRAALEKEILAGHGEQGEFFVTFLDNHDQERRFGSMGRARHPGQAALGLALLFTLQGIPCVYYGTEQGLTGHKTKAHQDDSMVLEALWGRKEAFDTNAALYQTIAALSALRQSHPGPALRRSVLPSPVWRRRDFRSVAAHSRRRSRLFAASRPR